MAAARCRRNVARCGRVVARHDLDQGGIAEAAARYEARAGVDFNSAPWLDFKDAPLGQNLGELVHILPAFDPFRDKFNDALAALDYRTADGSLTGASRKASSWIRPAGTCTMIGDGTQSSWRGSMSPSFEHPGTSAGSSGS